MKILVIGSGGREHALCWKLSQSPLVDQLFVAPGNPGMDNTPKLTRIAAVKLSNENYLGIAKNHHIDFTIVGTEAPLVDGIVDLFEKNKLKIFGPSKNAAQLEGSKIFSKNIMQKANVPTAKFETFDSYAPAKSFIESWPYHDGLVIKASELAAGKGVIVCHTKDQALVALNDLMNLSTYGLQAKSVVIEERLIGKELSAFYLCDGKEFRLMGHACDYKALCDDNLGPNTGGMGCYAPCNWLEEEDLLRMDEMITRRTLQQMDKEKIPFKGMLFVGVMMTAMGPKVLEYNVRFGDPETQSLMPLFEGDLLPWLMACSDGQLNTMAKQLPMKKLSAVHVVKAAKGYPGVQDVPIQKGDVITSKFKESADSFLFYAGVNKASNGKLISSGGRVLGLTALGENRHLAREKVYSLLDQVNFEGAQWRTDIGN